MTFTSASFSRETSQKIENCKPPLSNAFQIVQRASLPLKDCIDPLLYTEAIGRGHEVDLDLVHSCLEAVSVTNDHSVENPSLYPWERVCRNSISKSRLFFSTGFSSKIFETWSKFSIHEVFINTHKVERLERIQVSQKMELA